MTLTQQQKKKINEIGRRYGLILVLIFGSQIKRQTNQESDLDVAVLDSQAESYKRFGELYLAFSKIFPGHNLDLRFIRDAEPVFLYEVFKNSRLLYGDPQVYFNYRAFAYKNYIDSKSLFDLKSKILAKRQKELEATIK